jgi:hypothetical protein
MRFAVKKVCIFCFYYYIHIHITFPFFFDKNNKMTLYNYIPIYDP